MALCFLLSGYLFGGLTVYKQIWPFDEIRYLKNIFFGGSLQKADEPKPRNTIFQSFSPRVAVVMIGDSITEGGEWADMFPEVKIANRGIGGDRTDDILRRMEPIFSVHAKKAFLMIGINDVYSGRDETVIFNDYISIVRQLRSNGSEVYIQSTLECSKSKCGSKLQKVRVLNNKLKAYADEHGITFININNRLATKEDGLLSQYSLDGVHLLGGGYLEWRKTIAPYIYSH